ncbi:MAG: hypothetical protein OES46_12520 [Gammaproteobacteria bacterium]|jgi:hypothetical protein|nr:hypothetical protein [Gammaproteobacteria bacterium]
MIGKIVVGVLGGLVVAVLGLSVLPIGVIHLTGNAGSDAQAILIGLLVLWVLALVLAITAARAAKAWRRLLLVAAVLFFSLPLSAVIFAGARNMKTLLVTDTLSLTDAAIIGFFLGTIFLIIGLLVGRDKQVSTPPKRQSRRLIHRRDQSDRRTVLRWDSGAEDRRHGSGRRNGDEWDEMQAALSRSF